MTVEEKEKSAYDMLHKRTGQIYMDLSAVGDVLEIMKDMSWEVVESAGSEIFRKAEQVDSFVRIISLSVDRIANELENCSKNILEEMDEKS